MVGRRGSGERDMREPAALGDLLRSLLQRLGAADAGTWRRIEEEWGDIAGDPWDRQSRPVSLHDGVLIVEAVATPAVAVLRYGITSLRRRLDQALGVGVVTEVKVRPPNRRSS